jgi:ubiquinone/menaquinone biosynthesis C-methylase UbiE
MVDPQATDRVRRIWERYAPRYDRQMRFWEQFFFPGGREWVCGQARGETLEVAVGTGLNIGFYPDGVQLTGVDLSAAMLAVAATRAADLGAVAAFREADAERLPFPDACFDTVVCTLGLCSIPDDAAAIAEMHRVLRPGGRLLLLDHVAASNPVLRGAQRVVEVLTFRFTADYLTRRPLPMLESAGFVVETGERFRAGMVERVRAVRTAVR